MTLSRVVIIVALGRMFLFAPCSIVQPFYYAECCSAKCHCDTTTILLMTLLIVTLLIMTLLIMTLLIMTLLIMTLLNDFANNENTYNTKNGLNFL